MYRYDILLKGGMNLIWIWRQEDGVMEEKHPKLEFSSSYIPKLELDQMK